MRRLRLMITQKIDKLRQLPEVLVENKLSFEGPDSELGIYDTYQAANNVQLSSEHLLFCAMVTGKKIMHGGESLAENGSGKGEVSRDFFPHESFIMAPNSSVEIDFPEATLSKPTTCLAIELTSERVNQIANSLNAQQPLSHEFGHWQYNNKLLHTHHNANTQSVLNRIVQMYSENHPDRNTMIGLAISELTIRLLRQQTRDFILNFSMKDPEHNGLNAAITLIHQQLTIPLNIDELARISCMSRTKFFTHFKQHLGCSPRVYQQQNRLKKAAKKLAQGEQVTHVCFSLGFASSSHFSRSFKQFYGICPRQYKTRYLIN